MFWQRGAGGAMLNISSVPPLFQRHGFAIDRMGAEDPARALALPGFSEEGDRAIESDAEDIVVGLVADGGMASIFQA